MKQHPLIIGIFSLLFLTIETKGRAEWTIKVDAATKLGPSQIKNFMFVQGAPLLAGNENGSNEASRQFEIAAWKALDLTCESVQLIDGEPEQPSQGITVIRSRTLDPSQSPNLIGPLGPKKDLYLDTSPFEAMQDYYRETFGSNKGFRRVFSINYMPKTLSSNPSAANYYTYPPADYAEWRAVLEAAVRYLNKRGIHNPYIMLFGEPESDTVFNVLAPDGQTFPISTEPVIREYVRLYAESQRGVKAADPGAKVSAICSGVYSADLFRELRQAPEQKGLDDFIAYVAQYNRALPPGAKPAELDNICWQGYSWKDEKRMTPMVEHIQSVLARHGFDPSTPQYLSGWSGGWASPRPDGRSYPINLYAPHLVYNVIEQVNPKGKPGPIAQAHYYTWNLDGVYPDGAEENSSLVRTVHKRIVYDHIFSNIPSDQNCLRPAYIAFQALKTLEKANLLALKETRPALTRSIATADSNGIHLLLVNYTDKPQQVQIAIEHLPKTARVNEAKLLRVPEEEMCGDGNWFPSKEPLSTFLNEPTKLVQEKAGIVATSIPMAANTVALLHIPL